MYVFIHGAHTFPANIGVIYFSYAKNFLLSVSNKILAVICGCLEPKYEIYSMKSPENVFLSLLLFGWFEKKKKSLFINPYSSYNEKYSFYACVVQGIVKENVKML